MHRSRKIRRIHYRNEHIVLWQLINISPLEVFRGNVRKRFALFRLRCGAVAETGVLPEPVVAVAVEDTQKRMLFLLFPVCLTTSL